MRADGADRRIAGFRRAELVGVTELREELRAILLDAQVLAVVTDGVANLTVAALLRHALRADQIAGRIVTG